MTSHPPYGKVALPRDRTKRGRGAILRDRITYGRGAILRDRRVGSVLMEFLLVFPIILLLVSMLLQFGQIWIARQVTAYAAYCATRATLCVNTDEEEEAALAAARSVCAWMCLAGLSTDEAATLAEEAGTANWGQFHDMTDEVANKDTIYKDVSAQRSYEVIIPGWGSIPGSSSIKKRIRNSDVEVLQGGGSGHYAAVRVRFKFPLIFPLAGKIISWGASQGESSLSTYDSTTGEWSGDSYYSVHSGYHGKETVMDDDGNEVDRDSITYGYEGKFPVITLTETCVLPRPYLTTKFKDSRYKYGAGGGL